jgi:hypothetical protein
VTSARLPIFLDCTKIMSFANDPLSPFNDPHRDAADWPTTPHSPTNPHPTLVKPTDISNSALPPTSAVETDTVDEFVGANPRNAQNGSIGDGGPSTGPWGREPQIYGQPDTGLISPREAKSANGDHFEKPEPYLRVRITALDRNRRDILIRFDAQASSL